MLFSSSPDTTRNLTGSLEMRAKAAEVEVPYSLRGALTKAEETGKSPLTVIVTEFSEWKGIAEQLKIKVDFSQKPPKAAYNVLIDDSGELSEGVEEALAGARKKLGIDDRHILSWVEVREKVAERLISANSKIAEFNEYQGKLLSEDARVAELEEAVEAAKGKVRSSLAPGAGDAFAITKDTLRAFEAQVDRASAEAKKYDIAIDLPTSERARADRLGMLEVDLEGYDERLGTTLDSDQLEIVSLGVKDWKRALAGETESGIFVKSKSGEYFDGGVDWEKLSQFPTLKYSEVGAATASLVESRNSLIADYNNLVVYLNQGTGELELEGGGSLPSLIGACQSVRDQASAVKSKRRAIVDHFNSELGFHKPTFGDRDEYSEVYKYLSQGDAGLTGLDKINLDADDAVDAVVAVSETSRAALERSKRIETAEAYVALRAFVSYAEHIFKLSKGSEKEMRALLANIANALGIYSYIRDPKADVPLEAGELRDVNLENFDYYFNAAQGLLTDVTVGSQAGVFYGLIDNSDARAKLDEVAAQLIRTLHEKEYIYESVGHKAGGLARVRDWDDYKLSRKHGRSAIQYGELGKKTEFVKGAKSSVFKVRKGPEFVHKIREELVETLREFSKSEDSQEAIAAIPALTAVGALKGSIVQDAFLARASLDFEKGGLLAKRDLEAKFEELNGAKVELGVKAAQFEELKEKVGELLSEVIGGEAQNYATFSLFEKLLVIKKQINDKQVQIEDQYAAREALRANRTRVEDSAVLTDEKDLQALFSLKAESSFTERVVELSDERQTYVDTRDEALRAQRELEAQKANLSDPEGAESPVEAAEIKAEHLVLDGAIAKQEAKIQCASAEILKVDAKLANLNQQKENYATEVAQVYLALNEFESMYAQLLNGLVDDAAQFEGEVDEFVALHQELVVRVKELSPELSKSIERRLAQAKAELAGRTLEQLDKLTRETVAAQESIDTVGKRVDAQEKRVARLEEADSRASSQIADAYHESRNELLEEERAVLARLEELTGLIGAQKLEIDQKQAELDQSNATIDAEGSSDDEVNSAIGRVAELEPELSNAKAAYKALEKEQKKAADRREEIRAELVANEEELLEAGKERGDRTSARVEKVATARLKALDETVPAVEAQALREKEIGRLKTILSEAKVGLDLTLASRPTQAHLRTIPSDRLASLGVANRSILDYAKGGERLEGVLAAYRALEEAAKAPSPGSSDSGVLSDAPEAAVGPYKSRAEQLAAGIKKKKAAPEAAAKAGTRRYLLDELKQRVEASVSELDEDVLAARASAPYQLLLTTLYSDVEETLTSVLLTGEKSSVTLRESDSLFDDLTDAEIAEILAVAVDAVKERRKDLITEDDVIAAEAVVDQKVTEEILYREALERAIQEDVEAKDKFNRADAEVEAAIIALRSSEGKSNALGLLRSELGGAIDELEAIAVVQTIETHNAKLDAYGAAYRTLDQQCKELVADLQRQSTEFDAEQAKIDALKVELQAVVDSKVSREEIESEMRRKEELVVQLQEGIDRASSGIAALGSEFKEVDEAAGVEAERVLESIRGLRESLAQDEAKLTQAERREAERQAKENALRADVETRQARLDDRRSRVLTATEAELEEKRADLAEIKTLGNAEDAAKKVLNREIRSIEEKYLGADSKETSLEGVIDGLRGKVAECEAAIADEKVISEREASALEEKRREAHVLSEKCQQTSKALRLARPNVKTAERELNEARGVLSEKRELAAQSYTLAFSLLGLPLNVDKAKKELVRGHGKSRRSSLSYDGSTKAPARVAKPSGKKRSLRSKHRAAIREAQKSSPGNELGEVRKKAMWAEYHAKVAALETEPEKK